MQELHRNLYVIMERQKNDFTNFDIKLQGWDSKVLAMERNFIETEGIQRGLRDRIKDLEQVMQLTQIQKLDRKFQELQ